MTKNDIVAIRFLDHVQDGDTPMRFVVYGRVVGINKRAVTVCCWEYATKRKQDCNTEHFTIVRAAIEDVQVLRSH